MYDATQSPIAFSSVGNRYAFTGRRLDAFQSFVANPRLDLYHYRARAYDPFHGRFLQRDPAGYVDGMNLYEFARSSPQRFTDPDGKRAFRVEAKAFIHRRIGMWLFEPLSSVWQFKGDNRSRGQSGTSRLMASATIESTKLNPLKYKLTERADPSERRAVRTVRSGTRFEMGNLVKKGEHQIARAQVSRRSSARNLSEDPKDCTGLIRLSASAGYPFSEPFSPNIDFAFQLKFRVVQKGQIEFELLQGKHNLFPDYEVLIDNEDMYYFASRATGPGIVNLNWSRSVVPGRKIIVHAETPQQCCPE